MLRKLSLGLLGFALGEPADGPHPGHPGVGRGRRTRGPALCTRTSAARLRRPAGSELGGDASIAPWSKRRARFAMALREPADRCLPFHQGT
jgi:hypothetical protein